MFCCNESHFKRAQVLSLQLLHPILVFVSFSQTSPLEGCEP